MNKIVKSPKRSFKGWKLSKWFVGNWKTLKQLLKIGLPYLAATYFTNNLAAQGFITLVGKFALDAGEYWYKQYR